LLRHPKYVIVRSFNVLHTLDSFLI